MFYVCGKLLMIMRNQPVNDFSTYNIVTNKVVSYNVVSYI